MLSYTDRHPNSNLVPRPLPFLPSICIHNNTRKRKSNKKQGRPELIHHMSGHEVDVGGRGWYSNMYVLNLKVSFLLVKMSSFDHESRTAVDCSNGWSSALFLWLDPSPYVHVTSTWCHSHDEWARFSPLFRFCVLYWTQTEEQKMDEAWEWGYLNSSYIDASCSK